MLKGGVAPLIPDPVLARQPPETKKFNRNPSIHFDGARASRTLQDGDERARRNADNIAGDLNAAHSISISR